MEQIQNNLFPEPTNQSDSRTLSSASLYLGSTSSQSTVGDKYSSDPQSSAQEEEDVEMPSVKSLMSKFNQSDSLMVEMAEESPLKRVRINY